MNKVVSFGSWLKQRRKALDLTQGMLAERIGYSPRTLEKIESGERRASRQIAELLADALGVPDGERQAFVEFARTADGVAQPASSAQAGA